MAFKIEFSDASDSDLQRIRVFDQRRIVEAIQAHLTQRPNIETRNIKCLGWHITADFEFVPPLWELRVGEYRTFYEVDKPANTVFIHVVRRKPPDKNTSEVLNETPDS
jgi:mRNA-degrading endonuclease RelE of RelBE toxin-antitoxin system